MRSGDKPGPPTKDLPWTLFIIVLLIAVVFLVKAVANLIVYIHNETSPPEHRVEQVQII